jgi:PEP-CTERM motif
MRFQKCFLSLVVLSLFAAGSSFAASYTRGDLRPSGNGVDCSTVLPGSPCVGGSGNLLVLGDPNAGGTDTILTYYTLLTVNGITDGTSLTFTFGIFPDATQFLAVGCGDDGFGNIGIFTSVGADLGLPCTNFPGLTGPGTFISETDDLLNKTIQFQFSGQGLPSSWTFAFLSDSTGKSAFFPTSVVGGGSSVPEPATAGLLAFGIAVLGWSRRKKLR